MALCLNPKELILLHAKACLTKFRFGFEKAVVGLEYFPLDDRYFLGAKGLYQLQFDLGYNLAFDNEIELFERIGLIPVWSDPVC